MGSPTREAAEREAASANDRQVGGSHYRKGELQHWDIVDRFGVPYLEGVGSKYPLRWREKGGVEDLEKTLHYIDKILESPADHPRWQRREQLHTDLIEASNALCRAHGVGPVEDRVVCTLLRGFWRPALVSTRETLADYIAGLRADHAPGSPEDGGHHARQDEVGEEVSVVPPVTGRHLHIYLPEGCSGSLTVSGEQAVMKWGRL